MKKVQLLIEPENKERGDEGQASFGYDNHQSWTVLWSPLTAGQERKIRPFFRLILSIDLSTVDYKGQAEKERQNTEKERGRSAKELAPQWAALTSPNLCPPILDPIIFVLTEKVFQRLKERWVVPSSHHDDAMTIEESAKHKMNDQKPCDKNRTTVKRKRKITEKEEHR
ncbi:hypothetical protein GHT06_022337 [Daphnia sinensis]|uniref:Uncharacterized protein n=1 Tax=Daphnia sinensis TaxID=1820382 RepID=A0AAD5PQY2_9CRUS|nr:hypothetical protein GHT06_022337 [Daphnia sinensis]